MKVTVRRKLRLTRFESSILPRALAVHGVPHLARVLNKRRSWNWNKGVHWLYTVEWEEWL